jgi:hypothetical protein
MLRSRTRLESATIMNQRRMNRRFQIVIAPGTGPSGPGGTVRVTRFGRLKTLLAALGLAIVALAVLIAALILGYIITGIVCIVVVLVIAALLVKSVFQRKHQ